MAYTKKNTYINSKGIEKAQMTLLVDADTVADIKVRAAQAGMKISDWIKMCVNEYIKSTLPKIKKL